MNRPAEAHDRGGEAYGIDAGDAAANRRRGAEADDAPGGVEPPSAGGQILVVDDDRGIGECVELLLAGAGHRCVVVRLGQEGLAQLQGREFDLVITDLRLPDASGLDIVAASKAANPETQVILMTSFSSVESAIEALRRGANDYVIKPFDNDDFLFSVERALSVRRTRMENLALRRSLEKAFPRNAIVGESESVQRLQALIRRVAATEANVLIQGESGTGKELVAQAIHFGGRRAHRPFVAVNCGAIPAELIESELFGHAKGAFTGAAAASDGLIREAAGGTLFLDEISEMPLAVQVKLLRVLQERQVRPLGSSRSVLTDARFLAASNRNLKAAVENGSFRADLFYRLNVIAIQVPPLRERGDDVELLARHFARHFSARFGIPIDGLGRDFVEALRRHAWPGNVRELQNAIERAVILADASRLTAADLDETIRAAGDGGSAFRSDGAVPAPADPARGLPARSPTDRPLSIEAHIREVILLYQDRHGEAELAAMLGIGRKALWMRRRAWNLHRTRRGADTEAETEAETEADTDAPAPSPGRGARSSAAERRHG